MIASQDLKTVWLKCVHLLIAGFFPGPGRYDGAELHNTLGAVTFNANEKL